MENAKLTKGWRLDLTDEQVDLINDALYESADKRKHDPNYDDRYVKLWGVFEDLNNPSNQLKPMRLEIINE